IETWDVASREDEINDRPDIPHRSVATHDWRVRVGIFGHFLWAGGFAIAAQIEKINVVSARGDVIHPRHSVELEVEGRAGGVGCAMHLEYRALRTAGAPSGPGPLSALELDSPGRGIYPSCLRGRGVSVRLR